MGHLHFLYRLIVAGSPNVLQHCNTKHSPPQLWHMQSIISERFPNQGFANNKVEGLFKLRCHELEHVADPPPYPFHFWALPKAMGDGFDCPHILPLTMLRSRWCSLAPEAPLIGCRGLLLNFPYQTIHLLCPEILLGISPLVDRWRAPTQYMLLSCQTDMQLYWRPILQQPEMDGVGVKNASTIPPGEVLRVCNVVSQVGHQGKPTPYGRGMWKTHQYPLEHRIFGGREIKDSGQLAQSKCKGAFWSYQSLVRPIEGTRISHPCLVFPDAFSL